MNDKENAVRQPSTQELIELVRERETSSAEKAAIARKTAIRHQQEVRQAAEKDWPKTLEKLNREIDNALQRLSAQNYPNAQLVEVVTSVRTPWYSRSLRKAQIQYETVPAWVLAGSSGLCRILAYWFLSNSGELICTSVDLYDQRGEKVVDGYWPSAYIATDRQIVKLSADTRHGLSGLGLLKLVESVEKLGTEPASK